MAFDLAARRPLPDAVADLDRVLAAGLIDRGRVLRALATSRERDVRNVRRALELSDGRAESPPEARLRLLLVLDGLTPTPQLEVRCGGHFVARVDLGFAEERVAVEYDGAWHRSVDVFARDRDRLNKVQAAGWRTVFVTADRLRGDPQGVVSEVRGALATARRAGRAAS